MTEKRWGSLLGAIALMAGSSCAAHHPGVMNGPPDDVDTPVVLFADGESPCAIRVKESSVTSHPDKWLKFEITNHCPSAQTVMVGNFRTEENPSDAPTNCEQALHGGAPPIFQQDDANRRTAMVRAGTPGSPKGDEIKLKLRRNADLPGTGDLTYYFDVCLNGSVSKDPRLVVER